MVLLVGQTNFLGWLRQSTLAMVRSKQWRATGGGKWREEVNSSNCKSGDLLFLPKYILSKDIECIVKQKYRWSATASWCFVGNCWQNTLEIREYNVQMKKILSPTELSFGWLRILLTPVEAWRGRKDSLVDPFSLFDNSSCLRLLRQWSRRADQTSSQIRPKPALPLAQRNQPVKRKYKRSNIQLI